MKSLLLNENLWAVFAIILGLIAKYFHTLNSKKKGTYIDTKELNKKVESMGKTVTQNSQAIELLRKDQEFSKKFQNQADDYLRKSNEELSEHLKNMQEQFNQVVLILANRGK